MSDLRKNNGKKSRKILALLAGTALIVGAAYVGTSYASSSGYGWGHGMERGMGKDAGKHMEQVFDSADLNKDNILTAEEIATAQSTFFKGADVNNDGQVDVGEFETVLMDQMRPHLEKRFLKHDDNGDGTISQDEMVSQMSRMMSRLDRNDDGSIEKDEIFKHRKGYGFGHHGHDDDDGEYHGYKNQN